MKSRPHLFEPFFARMLPYDHLTVFYCWIIVILVLNFARPLEKYLSVLLFHGLVIFGVVLLVRYMSQATSRWLLFFRLLYPVILMTFFYESSGRLLHLFYPGFFDYQVVGFEKLFFGGDPTIWLDRFPNAFLTELMSAGYFSYYFMIPGLAVVYFVDRRDDDCRRFVTASCATFFLSYLVFIFYPVEGPRYYLASLYANDLVGPIFRPLVSMVIERGAIHGGAMPSSHVAEALVVAIFAVRSYGKRAYFIVPTVLTLALGTIYGRFHYATDVVAGIIVGGLAAWATVAFYPAERNVEQERELWEAGIRKRYASDNL